MLIKYIVLLIIAGILLVFSLWFVLTLVVSIFKKNEEAMYVPSFNRHIRLMKQLQLTRGKKLVDLGCGDAKAMRFFADQFGLQCEGYEMQWFPYRYGKLINLLYSYSSLKLFKKNFLKADLSKYDYIYVYLLPVQMAKIESRIFSHMGPHAIVISNSFQFAKKKPYEVINDKKGKASIFLYK